MTYPVLFYTINSNVLSDELAYLHQGGGSSKYGSISYRLQQHTTHYYDRS